MKGLEEMVLPPGYTHSFDGDSLTVYSPNGKVFGNYGPGFMVGAVEDDTWTRHLDVSEGIARLDGMLGRGESHARIVSEILDRFGIEGEERESYIHRCLMATVSLEVELSEPCPEPEFDWIGGTE